MVVSITALEPHFEKHCLKLFSLFFCVCIIFIYCYAKVICFTWRWFFVITKLNLFWELFISIFQCILKWIIASTKILHQMDWISTIAVLQKVVHSLSYPSKIFDQRNGSYPTSKKFFSTKNESKCTQTSQSVNLDGHCEFIFFLENDFYYGIQDCDLCFVLFFFI